LKKLPSIYIIRHAEKPEDPREHTLSDRGFLRSLGLPSLSLNPDVIFATKSTKESRRPVETVKPLARLSGLRINKRFKDHEVKELAQHILKKRRYRGKRVLICWHHGQIPKLIRALGGDLPPRLDPWPEEIFDRILKIQPPRYKGGDVEVVMAGQELLFGDSNFLEAVLPR
jgi:hypothetical protein